MHDQLAAHGSFAHLRLGRKPPVHDPRTLQFARYLRPAELPPVPAAASFSYDVPSWPMDGNDAYGNCTCAAAAHMVQAWTAAVGAEKTPSEADVMALYWATGEPPNTPCQPGGATDDGRDELGVLSYWRKSGLGSDRIGAFVAVDPTQLDHVRAALYLFGGLYTGIALPQTAQGQATWDVVGDGKTGPSQPGSWGGHAVPYEAFDADGFTVVTWGGTLKLTNAFHAAYVDEVYAVISPDLIAASGRTPEGFDLATLQADLLALDDQAR